MREVEANKLHQRCVILLLYILSPEKQSKPDKTLIGFRGIVQVLRRLNFKRAAFQFVNRRLYSFLYNGYQLFNISKRVKLYICDFFDRLFCNALFLRLVKFGYLLIPA